MTTIPASVTQVTLAAANPTRNKLIVYNQGDTNLYASTVNGFSKGNAPIVIGPQSGFIFPDRYTGAVYGLSDDAIGVYQVTEV